MKFENAFFIAYMSFIEKKYDSFHFTSNFSRAEGHATTVFS